MEPQGAAEPSPSTSTPALAEWEQDWTNALPELEAIARRRRESKAPGVSVLRASQLDAGRLDVELTGMLREQFMRIFKLFQPRVISQLQPELTTVLDFLVFRCSVWAGKPTPGQALLNLRYRDERARPEGDRPSLVPGTPSADLGGRSGIEGPGASRWQRALYGLGAVLAPYVWTRVDQQASVQRWEELPPGSWRGRAWALARRGEALLRLASLANFIVFLAQGRYRSLLERALGMRLVYSRGTMVRALSFEYLNRQLVWHELSTLLLLLLPLVSLGRIRAGLLARLPRLGRGSGAGSAPAASGSAAARPGGVGPDPRGGAEGDGEERQPCGICGRAELVAPYAALPCRHRHCYYCLRAATLADTQYACTRCGVRVEALQRWRPP